MAILILLVVFVVTIVSMAWYHTGYWRRRGIKSPTLIPFIGVLDRLEDPKHPNVIKYYEWSQEFGTMYGIQKGRKNFLIISDPDMAHELFTSKFDVFHERERNPFFGNPDTQERTHMFRARGKRWKRLRTISNPVFSVQNLKKIFPIIEDSANETIRLLEKASAGNQDFDIHPFMHEFTMDTIARIALGQSGSKQFKNDYTQILIDMMSGAGNRLIFSLAWIFPFLGPACVKLGMLKGRLKQKGFPLLLKNVYRAIHERKSARAAGGIDDDYADFIDFFLNAESDQVEKEITGVYDKSNIQVTKKLTFDEVVGQLILFLIAGFDTTANTLSITMFYLAKHPHIQERLRREIEESCLDPNVSYEDLTKLKYCESVMKEVLRLHPIAAMAMTRTAVVDTKLGNIEIEEGTGVHVDVFSIHYNKDIWGEDAMEFNPDRWLKGDVTKMMNNFYSFGGGPRICIGMRLAYIEEKLLLVYFLRRFRIKQTSNTEDKLKMIGNMVMNPEHVTIKLEHV